MARRAPTTFTIHTTDRLLRQWLNAVEGRHLEFKEAKGGYHFEHLVEYCVALANEGGGKIILGVTDRRPRQIVGTAAFAEPGRTESGLYDRLHRVIPIEELHTTEGRVLVVHVPSRLPGTAWQIDGRFLKRAGDQLTAMTGDELQWIFLETGPDFSAQLCPGATMDDLSPEAIADFRARWARQANDERRLGWTPEETLANAELIVNGQLTYAALILFGTRRALGLWLAQAEVIFEYRSSEASGPAADREEFRVGLFLCYDALWQKINLRNDRQSYLDGFFRVELPTFDERPVREAILNAMMHRDYRLGPSIFIRQYARRLEIVSPGGLPQGITLENILDQQSPRNRRLAEALNRCGLVERAGQGMNLMFESAIRQSKALPDFKGTAAHEVRLTMQGTVQDPAFVRYLERLGAERQQGFSTHDFLALDYIRRDQKLPEELKARLPALVEVGAVTTLGRGRGTRYLLSQGLYAELGARGVHTRRRGLDHETNKALIEQHLRSAGDAGAPLSDLQQVLPFLSAWSLRHLLEELRHERRVILSKRGRGARYLVPPSLTTDATRSLAYGAATHEEAMKALLEQQVRAREDAGASFSDLRQLVPTLSDRVVQRLLQELRSEGRVIVRGQRRWARWFTPTAKGQ